MEHRRKALKCNPEKLGKLSPGTPAEEWEESVCLQVETKASRVIWGPQRQPAENGATQSSETQRGYKWPEDRPICHDKKCGLSGRSWRLKDEFYE